MNRNKYIPALLLTLVMFILVQPLQSVNAATIPVMDQISTELHDSTTIKITDLFNFGDEKSLKVSDILKTISNTKDQTLEFNCHPSFSNNHLLSIRYAVYAYSKGAAHPYTWGYSYTIDLDRLKVLKLNDIIKLDKSILNYKGNVIFDRDTDSKPEKGIYKLIDVMNYNGLYTNKEVLNRLINENVCWYITKSKGVSFFFNAQIHDEEFVISYLDIKNLLKHRT